MDVLKWGCMKQWGTLWRAVNPLIGSVIGVGMFWIPYVFSQAGFVIGMTHLIVIGIANLVILLLYADIIMNTEGKARLTGIVRRYLGPGYGHLSTLLLFGSSWGAMIAYVIIGGGFLHALLSPFLPASLFVFQLLFFFVFSFLLIGGLGFVSRIESIFVGVLLILLFVLIVSALPYVEFDHLTTITTSHWFTPFGVILFAYGGLAAIPEMAHILGNKHKHRLRQAVFVGMGIVAVVYALFATIILAVTGENTSMEAIAGLGNFIGDWITVVGSLLGLFAVSTSFLLLGVSVADTMVYDYKQRYVLSWAITVAVPFVVFLTGARQFIDVIGFTGGVFGGMLGLLILYTYVTAKTHVCTPKRCLQFPNWIIFLTGMVFVVGFVMTVLGK